MKRIRVGLVGCGHRGTGLLKNLLVRSEFEVYAVCDTDRERLNQSKQLGGPGVKSYAHYRELLKDHDVEAVIVTTPQYTHRDVATAALHARKDVYCEKPFALSVAECDDIIEAARATQQVLVVGQQMRYHAHLHKMAAIIDSGELGKPVMIWLREFRNPFPENMKWAFDKQRSGGLLVEKNCHHFDVFRWFARSEPVSVYASGGNDVHRKPFGIDSTILDNAYVTVNFENGARASLQICMFMGQPAVTESGVGFHSREIGVACEQGMLRTEGFDLGQNVEVRYANSGNSTLHTIEHGSCVPGKFNQSGNAGILTEFADCIRERTRPFADGEVGKIALAMGVAAERSAEQHRVIEIKEVMESR
jgi:myo-inositol 2-dehydrogenase / D-chiro-inositol 1-dehydrogenase